MKLIISGVYYKQNHFLFYKLSALKDPEAVHTALPALVYLPHPMSTPQTQFLSRCTRPLDRSLIL